MITSRRVYLLVILILLFVAYIVPVDAGDPCTGASCDPPPPKAQACEHGNVDNKSKCPDHPEGLPEPEPTKHKATRISPPPTPSPGPTVVLGWTPPPPTATPGYHKATSIPFLTPTALPPSQLATGDVRPCYPVTDDVALLIEAVAEGYSIIIVKDVIATSSDDIVVISNE